MDGNGVFCITVPFEFHQVRILDRGAGLSEIETSH